MLITLDCGTLVNPTNGAVDTASGTTYGQKATFTCDTGYGIQGDSSRTCGADGQWTGNNPTCVIGGKFQHQTEKSYSQPCVKRPLYKRQNKDLNNNW